MATEVKKHQKKLRLKKGDKVKILTGRDKGKEGEIVRVLKENDRVVVAGLNIVKRHTKQSAQSAGGIINKELSLHISNVSAIDPKSGAVTKIGYKTLKDGKKVRFARKSGEVIG